MKFLDYVWVAVAFAVFFNGVHDRLKDMQAQLDRIEQRVTR